jgi:hypothetical protein
MKPLALETLNVLENMFQLISNLTDYGFAVSVICGYNHCTLVH